jgi:ferredoxin
MIIGKQKPIREIREMISPYRKILLLGCGTCVKTCFAGGEDEAAVLASSIRLAYKNESKEISIEELTIERQCEDAFIQEATDYVERNDAILSLGCGAGCQVLARRFPDVPVLPGVNTSFLGVMEKPHLFTEECSGCGDCQLARYGGICPVTRCSKRQLNGPCGGSQNGKCEIHHETDCAWALIIERLRRINQLENIRAYTPPRDWQASNSGGPRKLDLFSQ